MTLYRLLTTAAAAALIACPAIALAAADAPTPPAAPATPPPDAAAAPAPALPSIPKIESGPDLYETAKASGQFTILIKAIDATNLKSTLKGMANITMFAPTDAAFNALPPDQLAKLMSQENLPSLQRIILYHLVGAQVDSSKIKGAKGPVQTAEGSSLQIDGSTSVLMVNNADIIEADVHSTNGGILNAIDKVLVPPDSPFAAALTPPPAASTTPAPAASASTGTQ
jgi:uncharacterized surface protein with fasciclin (FAS1) repeats